MSYFKNMPFTVFTQKSDEIFGNLNSLAINNYPIMGSFIFIKKHNRNTYFLEKNF